ncbi:TetR/AcrR family transcriptional regulator [Myxococcota bacterium]|nr:TetR/AcrR family transcriptional regulator [Myxococcota bacterium]
MLDPGQDTRDRLLDAAERRFAAAGFAATSLRAVTGEAGVNVAAAHYHFGSKRELLRAVFARRMAPVNAERLERLDALEAGPGSPPHIEELLDAMLTPALTLAARNPEIAELGALIHSEPAAEVRGLLEEIFGEVQRRFTTAFHRCLPTLDATAIELRLTFSIGALAHSIAHRAVAEPEFARVRSELLAFLAAGMRATAHLPPYSPPGAPRREPT